MNLFRQGLDSAMGAGLQNRTKVDYKAYNAFLIIKCDKMDYKMW